MTLAVALTDESLVAGMASGDTDALAAFVRRFHARVFGLAFTVVADVGLAEEVTQDAFMRAWRHAAVYDPRRGRVATWLLTITRNLAVDAVRLRRDRPVDPDRLMGVLVGGLRGPQGGASRAGLAGRPHEPEYDGIEYLRTSLRQLPINQARPIVLAVVYGLTAQEIADREGIPLGTAKTRIRRGLARLRAALAVHHG